jgi:hypothetical protein
MDGGEPTVAGTDGHLPILLEVLKKGENLACMQVSQRQLCDLTPSSLGDKSQEQLPCVAVRAYGVMGEVPLISHPFMEERMQ